MIAQSQQLFYDQTFDNIAIAYCQHVQIILQLD